MSQSWEERRRAPRYEVRLDAAIAADGAMLFPGLIVDINRYGARVETGEHEAPDEFILLDVLGAIAYQARVVWRQPPLVGARFLQTWTIPGPDAPTWLVALRKDRLKARASAVGLRLVP